MTDKEFMMNYQQANSTILNIGKIIDDLKEQNFQLQAEISRLNQCTGTPKNPHNHSAEIKADSAQIDQNNKWIKQLDKLHKGISDLKALAQATDQKLVAYLEKMMNDRNISKDNEDIIADKQRINDLQNQIDNAENNPHIPPEQVDAMLKEVENCKNDIKLKQCSIDQLEKDNFSKQIEQAKLGGANSMQIDAMTAELNAKAEQVKQQIQDIQKEALQKVQAPEATTPKGIASDAGLVVNSNGTPQINGVEDWKAYDKAVKEIESGKFNDSKINQSNNNDNKVIYTIDKITSPYVYTNGSGKTGIYNTTIYTVADVTGISDPGSGILTQSEYYYLIYITLHEAGGLYVQEPEAQMTALASTYMNNYEGNGYNDFAKTMWNQCTQWAADSYTRDTLTGDLKNGNYSNLDFSKYTTEQIEMATKAVNTVLSGTRTTSSSTMRWKADNNNKGYNIFY